MIYLACKAKISFPLLKAYRNVRWAFFIPGLFLFTPFVHANWLAICEQAHVPNTNLQKKNYFHVNGDTFSLVLLSSKPKNCHSIEISLDTVDISWMDIVNRKVARRFGKKISLQGLISEGTLKISEIIPEKESTSSPIFFPLLIDQNILQEFSFRAFGAESRATVQRNKESITLRCEKGSQTAGMLFQKKNARLPLVKELSLKLSYDANNIFQVGVADQRRYEKGNPINIGSVKNSQKFINLSIPREKLHHKTTAHWSLLCPKEKSQLTLTQFTLHSLHEPKVASEKSMWFWKTSDWQKTPEKILSILQKYNADDVFITVDLDEKKKEIKEDVKLAHFIALAQQSGIGVWVVEGDPHVILPKATERFVKRAEIFAKFNNMQMETQQLAGIQYDIEPYLLAGYSLEPEQWAKAYVNTIRVLKQAAQMPLEIVIPFWWQSQAIDGQPMLSQLSGYVSSVNIMNYRTTDEMINRFAQPLLDWGLRNQTKLNIALEAGPIADEIQWRYQKATAGELWHVKIGEQNVLILGNKKKSNPNGNAYQFLFERTVSGSNVTFEHNKDKLINMLPKLEKQWSHWSSFNGISLHGLDE